MSQKEFTAFKADVNKAAEATQSLTSDFTQYKHMDFLSKDLETKGVLNYKAPNKVLWKYTHPIQYSVVFNNNKISINDAGKKSNVNIGNNKLFEKLNRVIVGTVNGNMFDEKEFKIAYFKSAAFNVAKFTPNDASLKKYLQYIEMFFDKDNHTVSEVKMTEPSGDYTRIVFQKKKLNVAITDAVFNQ